MPLVSVIIPVYNAEKYLKKCLDSVLEQTFQDFEIIAVNDGSTDGSEKILVEYGEKYPEKIKVYSKENSGQSGTRNMAMEKACGKYIAFLDSDDYIEKHYLEILVEAAEKNKSDMVCSGQKRVDAEGNILSEVRYQNFKNGNSMRRRLNISGKLYLRSYLEMHNITFAEGKKYEDNPFNLVAMFLAKNFVTVDYEGYYQLVHVGSTTTMKMKKELLPLDTLEEAIQYVLNKKEQINDEKLFEFTVISFFTYFLFKANKKHYVLTLDGRKSDLELLFYESDFFKRLLNEYIPNNYKNPYTKIFSHYGLEWKQKAGVWIYICLVRLNLEKQFLKLYYRF